MKLVVSSQDSRVAGTAFSALQQQVVSVAGGDVVESAQFCFKQDEDWEALTHFLESRGCLSEWSDDDMAHVNGIVALHGARWDRSKPLWKEQLLLVAARYRDVSVVKWLLAKGAYPALAFTQCGGRTPLHIAAEYGNIEVAQELFESARRRIDGSELERSEIGKIAWLDRSGMERCRSEQGWVEDIRHLVDVRTQRGLTPLMIAVKKVQPEMVEMLLSWGADSGLPDRSGSMPLHWTALYAMSIDAAGGVTCYGSAMCRIARALVRSGCDRNAKGPCGRTAYQMIAYDLESLQHHNERNQGSRAARLAAALHEDDIESLRELQRILNPG
jgi:hypothetical protein